MLNGRVGEPWKCSTLNCHPDDPTRPWVQFRIAELKIDKAELKIDKVYLGSQADPV